MGAMVKANLEAEGFAVAWETSGEGGLAAHGRESADLVVLDLNLPGMGGFEVLATLRRRADKVPVIILTARSGGEDRVRGLSSGADDYVTKPFAMLELVARIQAILRRSEPEAPFQRTARSGPYRIDYLHFTVFRGRTDLGLGLKEFRLLEVLVAHPGRVHSRADLVNLAWEADARPTLRTVDRHIHALRKKLGDSDENPAIQTLEREGYRWTLPVKR
ncbi:DNA-binding response regulator [Mesoterricola sediminis]|uniref:DNA-binding response regulator n=2 Tax=Mesoterricola sediminis TaxID=2927980 RepID=A0AA48GRT6_9BACT|nr:DNA-binding response regulator [Mesoterricola sediminis]